MGCIVAKAEAAKLQTIIAAMYHNFEITDFKTALWFDMIGDLSFKVAQMALKKVMLTSQYPPTVAEVRKAAAEIMTPQTETLDAGKAWGEVTKAIGKWGFYEPEKAFEMMSPLTQQVVKQLSWREICMCEETGVIRGEFMRMFNSLSERQKQDKLLPKKFTDEIELIATNLKQIGTGKKE